MTQQISKYTKTAICLHWINAILMIGMLVIGEDFIRVRRDESLEGWGPSAHATFGILILLLALARLFWRIGNPPPALPATMPKWQTMASHATHWAFYALMIAIPVLGLMALIPYGESRTGVENVKFLGLIPLAFLPNFGEWSQDGHELMSKAAQILVIVHVLAALKHQFWDKDGLLSRMRPM